MLKGGQTVKRDDDSGGGSSRLVFQAATKATFVYLSLIGAL